MTALDEKGRLFCLLEPTVEALGYELIDLDLHTGGRGLLRVFIDGSDGIGLDDCELVSRQLSDFLDVEDPIPGNYVLEISSPGTDRRLRTIGHFEQFRGQEVRVRLKNALNGMRKFRGFIDGVQKESVLIRVDGQILNLNPSEIDLAKLIPDD